MEALDGSAVRDRTLVVLTSDHGESLGEHGYYFDHGENLFDPSLRVPLLVVAPGAPAGRRVDAFASTLDLVPTILDAAKVSWPPDLAGTSLLRGGGGTGGAGSGAALRPERPQPDRRLLAGLQDRGRSRRRTGGASRSTIARRIPGRRRTSRPRRPEALREERRELELFLERADREWARMRPLLLGATAERRR